MADERKRKMLGATFIKLNEEGQTFEGKLVKREPMVVQGNSTFRYTFQNLEGRFAMIGTRHLDDALSDAELGIDVEIKFLRTEKMDSGFELKHYEVAQLE